MGKDKDGQALVPINTNDERYVAQANEFVEGRQNLKLNSAKIMRAVIMQINADDDDINGYTITIPELAAMLGIQPSNLYHEIDNITNDITSKVVEIKDRKSEKFVKFPWTKKCAYDPKVGLNVALNDEIKPYVLNLKSRAHYTQYQIQEILQLKSVYGIRIFELLEKEQYSTKIPPEGKDVELTIEQIRIACDCQNKYKKISQFKARVIDTAIKDIERVSNRRFICTYIKRGRSTYAINFRIIPWYSPYYDEKTRTILESPKFEVPSPIEKEYHVY